MLAQRLAANDKKSRDRALRKLRRYLLARSSEPEGGFSAVEVSKIWKGLFYCMWMQDKPLLQEELALTMSQLVHALQTRPSQNLFLRSFWQTLNREWTGIDRLRLDKFYTLTRFVLRESVELLKKEDWEESVMGEFLSVLEDEVLKAEAPRGVQQHLIDIYLDELAKVGSSELSADLNLKLIDPFCTIAATAKDHTLRHSVVDGIFQTILEQSPFALEDLMKEVGHTPADDGDGSESGNPAEDCEDIGPVLQFDYQALADRLFHLASRKNVPPSNRKHLYQLVKRFKDLAEGIFPGAEYSSKRKKKAQEKTARDSSRVALTDPKKRGKRRRRKRGAVTTENPPEPPAAKKQKKDGKAEQPKVNGVTHRHPNPKDRTGEDAPPPEQEPSQSSTRLRKRRRSCLLRIGLSVLPLRGAVMMRRRRLVRERRKMLSNKAPPIIQTSAVTSSPAAERPAAAAAQDFITFQKPDVPKPVYVKGTKSRGRPIGAHTNCKSKKVTFSLNKNMTAEFKRTDRSLLVSPTGSSRVPFNPNQQPQHSVLKTPTPPRRRVPRAKAADFF